MLLVTIKNFPIESSNSTKFVRISKEKIVSYLKAKRNVTYQFRFLIMCGCCKDLIYYNKTDFGSNGMYNTTIMVCMTITLFLNI